MRLHDYLTRLAHRAGESGPADRTIIGPPTFETLRRLHVAHRETFLFENLSIQTGGPISVELPDIERKFLDQRRGGYCFEHNTLFGAALRDAGFGVVALLGRVRRGPPERWARTHMVLRVDVTGAAAAAAQPEGPAERTYLADVGFGAIGLMEPIPFRTGTSGVQRGITYALRKEGPLWILAMTDTTGTADLYEFTEDAQTLGDITVANHYTATHPESMFRKTLTIQGVCGNERVILRNEKLSRWTDGQLTEETIDRARMPQVARDLFGIELPDGPFVFEKHEGMGRAD
jgi:N-hydroxyarylamine O-acetyltransferase